MAIGNYELSSQVNIKDPSINRMILWHLMEQLEGSCLPNNIKSILNQIKNNTLEEWILASFSEIFRISVEIISDDALSKNIKIARTKIEHEFLKNYFINNYASKQLIRDLFSISIKPDESIKRKAGRPKFPEPQMREKINVKWAELKKEYPIESVRDRLFKLHQEFSWLRIDQIEASLKEHGDQIN